MQMLLRIQELAAIRQLPQSLGSLSSFRLFSAAQVVTPDPKVQPGQGPPRFYKSVGVRPASDQAGPCHATSETAVVCPLDAKLSCRKAGMSHSITKTSKRQQGIPCWSQPGPWLLPLQLSGSGRSADRSRCVVECVAHHSGPALPNVPLLSRTGEYVPSPCHSCPWLQQPLTSPSRESASSTQWCSTSAQMPSAAEKRRALWLPGSLRQAYTPTHDRTGELSCGHIAFLSLFACHQCQVKSGCLSGMPSKWLLVSVQTLDPILRWARQHFQAEFDVTSSIFGSQHNPDATSAVSAYLQGQQPGFQG